MVTLHTYFQMFIATLLLWQNKVGLANEISRRSFVQYNLSCPPRYMIRTKQATNKHFKSLSIIINQIQQTAIKDTHACAMM